MYFEGQEQEKRELEDVKTKNLVVRSIFTNRG